LLDSVHSPHPTILHKNTNLPTLPAIQGDADVGKHLYTNELQKVITFCGGVFLLINPELHSCITPCLDNKLLNPNGPIITPEEIELLMSDNIEAQLVLKEINIDTLAMDILMKSIKI